jgi:probable rRNA maturation factor
VKLDLAVQNVSSLTPVPTQQQFEKWVSAALQERGKTELLIRLVDRQESRQLNTQYGHKDKATNVLSFPADLPEEIGLALLGDIIICAPIVAEEAQSQCKPVETHWAHLAVHGVLHLLGHDHQVEEEASAMESLEIKIMQTLGYPDPYRY